jgi:predicted nuclease of predicted toxin-antitoxin system
VKFLIDECLSPELAGIASARGFPESRHVTWLGMRSRKDWAIVSRAIREGFILVTNNTSDFTALYEREEIHPGLLCLNVARKRMNLGIQKSLVPVGARCPRQHRAYQRSARHFTRRAWHCTRRKVWASTRTRPRAAARRRCMLVAFRWDLLAIGLLRDFLLACH